MWVKVGWMALELYGGVLLTQGLGGGWYGGTAPQSLLAVANSFQENLRVEHVFGASRESGWQWSTASCFLEQKP